MEEGLRRKIEDVFGSYAVDKQQALRAGFERMPRFVVEFLIASARSKNAGMGIEDVRERIRKFSVDADRRGEVVSRLMREGSITLIGLLDAEPRPAMAAHTARIAQLGETEIHIDDHLVAEQPELLYGGLWGSVTLRYDTSSAKPRILVERFTPYQLTRPDMDKFRTARGEFTLDEWLALLLTSAGYRPEAFPTFREKLLVLARLVPLVQSNVNLLELGPRGTGKSYLLRNLSPRVYLLAGARATPAALLYDLNKNQVGIIGRKKVVVFDEIGATQFPDRSLVAALKDFMEAGTIVRGGRSLVSDCSLVLSGNLDLAGDGSGPSPTYGHLLEVLPGPLVDTAIGERLHGILPGWEMPKISDHVLADGVGLLSDYFGEVVGQLRGDLQFQDYIRSNIELAPTAKTRDRTAIERLGAGLLKLLYPNRRVEEQGLVEALTLAVELRQRVHNQLVKMAPGEYAPKRLSFKGMARLMASDLADERPLAEQDVEANQRDQVGRLTILLVNSTGGGDVGFIECSHIAGREDISLTGMRGAVLQQSVRAAYNAVLKVGHMLGVPAEIIRKQCMSVHLVNIAVPKDGPSAGLAFAVAMISAVTGRPVRRGVAVTGELSVHGNVTAVGGIPEKLSAAPAHGRTKVVIPAENMIDLSRLKELTEKLEIVPVRTLEEGMREILL